MLIRVATAHSMLIRVATATSGDQLDGTTTHDNSAYVYRCITGLAEAFRDSVASGKQLSSLAPTGLTGFMLFSFGICCVFSFYAVRRILAPTITICVAPGSDLNMCLRNILCVYSGAKLWCTRHYCC